uniref:Uncharacterized protein n=1 Tax=Meloidogyne incognita TaxID=6306 RepID=A0A914N1A5_MELIC
MYSNVLSFGKIKNISSLIFFSDVKAIFEDKPFLTRRSSEICLTCFEKIKRSPSDSNIFANIYT